MKAFLFLICVTLSLGSALSLHLTKEMIYYLPLYLLSIYHLYVNNYSKGFFLVFLTEPDKKDLARVRIGPSELEAKDDAERDEDKFLELFDWKKAYTRRTLSWLLFAGSIYYLFFKFKVEISLESLLPVIISLCLMRVIAVGHLLMPLALNLFGALRVMNEYNYLEYVLLFVYGVLFIINLALIYPSEERMKGKWPEAFGSIAILLITFITAWFLLKDFKWKNPEAPVSAEEIQEEILKVEKVQSSLNNLMETGLMKDRNLLYQANKLSEKMKERPGQAEFKSLKEKSENLEKDFQKNLAWGPCPALTPELLHQMKKDLTSRGPKEIDPEMEKRIQNFLKKAENFSGTGGDELISEYRDMKFGKGGFYKEQTEFDHNPINPAAEGLLKEIQKTEEKKKEVSEKLTQNIEELKQTNDQSLLPVNKALKDELDRLDSLASDERELFTKEIEKSQEIQKTLESKVHDPALREKLQSLAEENHQLSNQLTPHMKAADKSQLAGKILEHKKKLESAGREVREEVAAEIAKQEIEKPLEVENDNSKLWNKILRIGAFAIGAFLVLWFIDRLSKKGVKKVRGIPDEVKEELSNELKAISRKKLSPREEVIETYNVFHDGLKTLIFTNETPPSCIVYEGISAAEPQLQRPTFTVTETFARTFYGERDVSLSELKTFRKDVRKIFSFFEITY